MYLLYAKAEAERFLVFTSLHDSCDDHYFRLIADHHHAALFIGTVTAYRILVNASFFGLIRLQEVLPSLS
jgi:hypothetical protein